MASSHVSHDEDTEDSDDQSEDDDGLRQNHEDHSLSEERLVLSDSSDCGGSDIFLGHTGSETGESDSESCSDSDESNSCVYHLFTPLWLIFLWKPFSRV